MHTTNNNNESKLAPGTDCFSTEPSYSINLNNKYTTEVCVPDVLFGRGMIVSNHAGNVAYRQLIRERREAYMTTNNRRLKNEIASQICSIIKDVWGGRFLREIKSSVELIELGFNVSALAESDIQIWLIVDDETSKDKIKHALREIVDESSKSEIQEDSSRRIHFSSFVQPISNPNSTDHAASQTETDNHNINSTHPLLAFDATTEQACNTDNQLPLGNNIENGLLLQQFIRTAWNGEVENNLVVANQSPNLAHFPIDLNNTMYNASRSANASHQNEGTELNLLLHKFRRRQQIVDELNRRRHECYGNSSELLSRNFTGEDSNQVINNYRMLSLFPYHQDNVSLMNSNRHSINPPVQFSFDFLQLSNIPNTLQMQLPLLTNFVNTGSVSSNTLGISNISLSPIYKRIQILPSCFTSSVICNNNRNTEFDIRQSFQNHVNESRIHELLSLEGNQTIQQNMINGDFTN